MPSFFTDYLDRLHAITHMAVHAGPMQLVRQLWEQTATKHNGEQSA